jgi:hypothetical protein
MLPFVVSALEGFDNSTIQLTWRDLHPDTPNATIVFAWNSNASNIGSLSYVKNITFAQRSWQFEFRNVLSASTLMTAADGAQLGALAIAQILAVVLTVLCVRYRYDLVCVCDVLCVHTLARTQIAKRASRARGEPARHGGARSRDERARVARALEGRRHICVRRGHADRARSPTCGVVFR